LDVILFHAVLFFIQPQLLETPSLFFFGEILHWKKEYVYCRFDKI